MTARRERLAALGRRTRETILLSAVTGLATGAVVALFEEVTRHRLFEQLADSPRPVRVLAPVAGLLIAAAALRWIGGDASPSTADEYISNFHDANRRLPLRAVPARIVASVATLGSGGALGYEGPSILLGAAVGDGLQARLARFFSREDAKVLLVCGAAAGVAAIFKAPATGMVFALEVPYQEDVARRMLLPAGIAAAVSYVTFVSLVGTEPLLAVSGQPPFALRDLAGAAVLGVCCGVGARWYTQVLVGVKALAVDLPPFGRALAGGAGLALLATLSFAVFDEGLTLGAGYDNIEWALDAEHGLGLVALLLALRVVATVVTVGGGGAGGLFIPLVVAGALVGRLVGGVFGHEGTGTDFFPLVGVAAFLAAGYRVPLAGVMFVAESTGRPGFIVPGVIASMVAQLFMGRASASAYQATRRAGHLERRFVLPLTTALRTDVATAPPDTTLEEFVWQHLLGNRQQAVPVVDGSAYLGVMRIDEAMLVPRDEWPVTLIGDHMRADYPTIGLGTFLRDALVLMEEADVDLLPVVDGDTFVGIVTTDEILHLDEILGRAEDEQG